MDNNKPIEQLSELELVYLFIVKGSRPFIINPTIFGHIRGRGLYHIINYLPTDVAEAKKVALLRMYEAGKLTKLPEETTEETRLAIAEAESLVNFIRGKQQELVDIKPSELHKIKEVAQLLIDACTELETKNA